MQGYGQKSITVKRLIMQETGTYNSQFRRPFESHLTGDVQNQIEQQCRGSGHITAQALTGLAGGFIKPCASPESPIMIPNGWNSRRYRFFMEVESVGHMGTVLIQYVTGYTDKADASFNNNIDPRTMFYINNVTITRVQRRSTPIGMQNTQVVIDSSHLLHNPHYGGVYDSAANHLYTMRPQDVFDNMTVTDLQGAIGRQGDIGSFDMHDMRTILNANGIKATRKHASAPMFVAGILDSYRATKNADVAGISHLELCTQAAGHVESARIMEDPFVKMLSSSKGVGGMFMYSELLRIDPTIDSRKIFAPLAPAQRATLHEAGQTSHWSGSDYETQFATILSQSVPGYMLDYGIQDVTFSSTNEGAMGIVTLFENYNSLMQGVNLTESLDGFKAMLNSVLFRDLSYNNQVSYMVRMRCSLTGDIRIELRINGGPVTPFTTPCFADHLITPMVTGDKNKFDVLTKDLSLVVDQIVGDEPHGLLNNSEFGTFI